MMIFSKDRKIIVNATKVKYFCLYQNFENKYIISACFGEADTTTLGEYSNEVKAKKAMGNLWEKIRTGLDCDTFVMPDDED